MENKRLLYEISVIRPAVIGLLVVYHALCIYTGGWAQPSGIGSNALYWWLGQLISGFRIETIALVGGYVFSYQSVELGRRTGFLQFAWKKTKRLLIPALLFGAAYYLLFRYRPGQWNGYIFFWKLLNGVGHLWFLPMLFWCFMLSWLIDAGLNLLRRRSEKAFLTAGWVLLAILAACSVWQPTGLRMGLTRVPHFIFYFYMGYWLRIRMAGRELQPDNQRCLQWAIGLAVIYFIVLCLRLQVWKYQLPGMPWVRPGCLGGATVLTLRILKLVHTTSGMLALFFLVWHLLYGKGEEGALRKQPSPMLREASRLCYGIYVYHMFFMEWLYFRTSLPALLSTTAFGAWILPWTVLIITMALSAAATWLTLLLPAGRKMIG